MVQTKRGAAAAADGNNTESGSGETHTAGSGIGSTQGYKPKPLLFLWIKACCKMARYST